VSHPELATEIETDAACAKRMDPGSRAFMEFYNNTLQTEDARMDLVPIAIFARNEQLQIEYRHQRMRRFAVGRSLQRRVVDVAGLNIFWITDCLEIDEKGLWGAKKGVKRKRAASTECSEVQPGSAEPSEPDRKRRKLCGWNVFVQERTAGKTDGTREPTGSIGQMWKAMSAVQQADYIKKAMDGNDAADAGRVDPLGSRIRSTKRRPMICDDAGANSMVPHRTSLALVPCTSLLERIPEAATTRRLESSKDRGRMEQERIDMLRLNASPMGVVSLAQQAHPELCRSSGIGMPTMPQWSGGGTSGFQHLRARCSGVLEKAKQIPKLDTKAKSLAVGALHEAMQKVFRDKCSIVQHCAVDAVDAESARKHPLKDRICFAANKCMCNPRGRVTLSILTQVNKASRASFPRSDRTSLINAKIVVMFLGYCLPCAPDGLTIFDHAQAPIEIKWFHITQVNQRPWELLYAEMDYDEFSSMAQQASSFQRTEAEMVAPDRCIRLVCPHRYYTPYEVPAMLLPSYRWDLVFWHVEFEDRLIGTFKPNCLDIMLRDPRIINIWNPCKAKPETSNLNAWASLADASGGTGENDDVDDDLTDIDPLSDHHHSGDELDPDEAALFWNALLDEGDIEGGNLGMADDTPVVAVAPAPPSPLLDDDLDIPHGRAFLSKNTLGYCGFSYATVSRSSCMQCRNKIAINMPRFHFRKARGKCECYMHTEPWPY
jgi:hypothetical protein